MKKQVLESVVVNNSNTTSVINEESAKRVANRVKNKPNLLEDTANSLDEESPKKKQVFDDVKKLFGFEIFDENTFAEDMLKNGCTYSELKNAIAKERKRVNANNDKLESLPLDMVIEKISNSLLLSDVSLFVGTNELVTLTDKLVNDKKQVILYHGKQSEEGEKFESFKVTVKGLHKPFEDTCYFSLVDYSVSNVIRALRNYSYYLASVKRCKKMRNTENDYVGTLKSTINELHKKFGYSKEDITNILDTCNF